MQLSRHNFLRRQMAAVLLFAGIGASVFANPTGMTLVAGTATPPVTSGSQLTITVGNNAFLNWQNFDIAAGETTIFQQPSAASIVWNRINGPTSQINGTLQANGIVVLLNSSGFNFGPNSFVSAAGLVVSTANCIPPQNSGGTWEFNGPPPMKSIINYGQIQVGQNGSVFLIADDVENHGTISAPGGTVGLAAGQTVLLSERPDGRGMSMAVTLPQGSVNNYGTLTADAGTIAMNARVVNQNGLIQANSVQNQNGVIELVAAGTLHLGADSQISAHGNDSSAGSSGGSVTLQSGNNFSDDVGSRIDVSGGTQGGNGGNVEISAPNILSLNSAVNAVAQSGWNDGVFALDPVNIVLGNSGATGPDSSGTIDGTSGSGTLNVNVNTAFLNITAGQILLEASGNISLNANTTWDLTSSTGGRTSGQLTLEANGDITFGNNSKITDANNWSVALEAGYSFANSAVQYDLGNIYLNNNSGGETGGGSIQTAGGNIKLVAGNNILLGGSANGGYVRTTKGGNIDATALAGDVDTGSYAHGYTFSSSTPYIRIDPTKGTGGISTEAGGNVTITAGQDIISVLPTTASSGDAGSGAFGPGAAGNVTLVAGGNVVGHYVVADGVGAIYAGVLMNNGVPVTDASGNYVLNPASGGSAGTADNKLALSLIDAAPISPAGVTPVVYGGWTVDAVNDIYLQEVRNPNGIFNAASSSSAGYHYFDYAAGDYLNLSAGNAVVLGGSSTTLPRADIDIPFIYPPILNISAGPGGVSLVGDVAPYNELILFPSGQGSMDISTTGGGSLSGTAGSSIFQLIVSDSSQSQYNDPNADIFGLTDHASTPVHYGSLTPVELNISGNMDNVLLGAPEAAQINVVGDMINSRFQGQNLSAGDTTSINVGQSAKTSMENSGLLNPATDSGLYVGGSILNRSEFTTINYNDVLAGNPDAAQPEISLLTQSSSPLTRRLFYDSNTRELTFQGPVTDQILSALANMTIQVNLGGVPQFNQDGTPKTEQVNILDPDTATGTLGPNALALQAEYAVLGNIPSTLDNGYLMAGGGKFNITAANLDLGSTLGIVSGGVEFNPALAGYITQGADINVTLSGNLDMFSTTISSLAGGHVSVDAGGYVNAGSSIFTGNDGNPRGIFTSLKSDVTVIAGGDINLNGSRIAAYDGGNVTVESLHGNVDAGTGANGKVVVNEFYVDQGQIFNPSQLIPGSGILATTFNSPSVNTLGNILVETPEGNIIASLGGILQFSQNGVNSPDATVQLLTGYELRDTQGNPVLAKDLGQGTPVPIFSNPNVVTLGSTIQVQPADSSLPVSLTQVLDASGNPLLDTSSGHLLYVGTSDPSRQLVEFVDGSIQPYNNDVGETVNVAKPKDAAGNTFDDAQGNPILVLGRNIDATGSGIIGSNVKLAATGNIKGLVFGQTGVAITAQQNIDVTALSSGNVSVNSANGSISGNIVGSSVSASGDSIDATVLSQNASVNGQSGGDTFAQGTAANATAQAASSDDSNKAAASSDQSDDDDKKKKKDVALAQKTGRVTVILPGKSPAPASSQKQTATQPL